jgi:hypothetical protein
VDPIRVISNVLANVIAVALVVFVPFRNTARLEALTKFAPHAAHARALTVFEETALPDVPSV